MDTEIHLDSVPELKRKANKTAVFLDAPKYATTILMAWKGNTGFEIDILLHLVVTGTVCRMTSDRGVDQGEIVSLFCFSFFIVCINTQMEL